MMSGKVGEKVLVFGDDMRIFLAVVRSLGRAGKEVHAAPFNWRSPALKSKYISAIHYFPRYSDDANAWRAAVLKALRTHSYDLVIPCCDDRAILPFHTHREDFSEFRVAIPNPAAMELLFDKEQTRELCVQLDIPIAEGRMIEPQDRAPELVARFGLPIVLKPRRSFWIDQLDSTGKVSINDSESELQARLNAVRDASRYIIQGYFKGVGVGVSVLAQDGKILHAFQHRRLREGRGGSSSYRISEAVNPDLRDACNKICRHTNLTGVCMFEFRWNPSTRDWILLETNARFWGSCPLPISLGIDFPLYLYDLMVHRRQHEPASYVSGVTSRNVLLDGCNLITGLRYTKRGDIGHWLSEVKDYLLQPIRLRSGREQSDTFVRDDLKPALWECITLLRDIRHRLTRHRGSQVNRRHRPQTA